MSFDELAVDSLTLLELLTAIENEFDLELDDEAFGACNDLGEMSDMILAKIRG